MAYDLGSIMAGGTPQIMADPSLVPRVAAPISPVPAAQPSLIQRLGGGATKWAPAMAMAGQLLTGAGGKGLLANDISALATKLAAGRLTDNVANPQGQAQPQQTRVAEQAAPDNTDANQNGIPDRLEVKITQTGNTNPSRVSELVKSLAGNFPNSTGDQAGTPVAASPSPAPMSQSERNMTLLSGMTDPGFALEASKQVPVRMKAEADMLDAQVKHYLAPSQAAKLEMDARDTQAKLYNLYSYSPQAKELIAYAEAKGKKLGEQVVIDEFMQSPLGGAPVPPEFYKIGVPPSIRTLGELAKASGTMDAIHDYARLVADRVNTQISASGRIGAAKVTADAQTLSVLKTIESEYGKESRFIQAQIDKLGDPNKRLLDNANDEASRLATIQAYKTQLGKVQTVRDNNMKALVALGEGGNQESTPATTPLPKGATDVKQDTYQGKPGRKYKLRGQYYFQPD